jgi:hypothetical protein
MNLDWLDLLKLVLASSLVSALVNVAYNYIKDRGSHKRDRKHAALTAALALEKFARDADATRRQAAYGVEEAVRCSSYDPIRNVALPDFEFPDEIDWKWLDQSVAARLRDFPQGIPTTRRSIVEAWEFGDPIVAAQEVELRSATLGKRALELAREVRRAHGVDPWVPDVVDADLEGTLWVFITEREEVQRAQQERWQQEVLPSLQAINANEERDTGAVGAK